MSRAGTLLIHEEGQFDSLIPRIQTNTLKVTYGWKQSNRSIFGRFNTFVFKHAQRVMVGHCVKGL